MESSGVELVLSATVLWDKAMVTSRLIGMHPWYQVTFGVIHTLRSPHTLDPARSGALEARTLACF